jgi:hypothetical protein
MTATDRNPLTLALLIYSGVIGGWDLEHRAYDVIDKLLEDWSDEKRADLYARIVEGCPTMTEPKFLPIEKAVRKAWAMHEREWRG